MVPIVLLFFVIGLAPNFFLDKINPSVAALEVVQTPAIGDEWLVDSSNQSQLISENNPLTITH